MFDLVKVYLASLHGGQICHPPTNTARMACGGLLALLYLASGMLPGRGADAPAPGDWESPAMQRMRDKYAEEGYTILPPGAAIPTTPVFPAGSEGTYTQEFQVQDLDTVLNLLVEKKPAMVKRLFGKDSYHCPRIFVPAHFRGFGGMLASCMASSLRDFLTAFDAGECPKPKHAGQLMQS